MTEISIVLATRSGATAFAGPMTLLRDMRNKAGNTDNFEVIIRVDDDDPQKALLESMIEEEAFPFRVAVVSGSRGRGYIDLHRFYNECYLVAAPEGKIIFSLPEDVAINVNRWDEYILHHYEEARKNFGHDIFTIHQTLNPGLTDNYESCLETPDSFPMYTRSWMNALGGFCHTGANDSWVIATHHFLQSEQGLSVRHFLPQHLFMRHTEQEQDSVISTRWANERMINHELMRQDNTKHILRTQAHILYLHASAQLLGDKASRKGTDHIYDTTNYLINRFGAASVFFRSYYVFLERNTKQKINEDFDFLTSTAPRLMRLKNTVPFIPPYLHEIYGVTDCDTVSIERPYNHAFFAFGHYTDAPPPSGVNQSVIMDKVLHGKEVTFKEVMNSFWAWRAFQYTRTGAMEWSQAAPYAIGPYRLKMRLKYGVYKLFGPTGGDKCMGVLRSIWRNGFTRKCIVRVVQLILLILLSLNVFFMLVKLTIARIFRKS